VEGFSIYTVFGSRSNKKCLFFMKENKKQRKWLSILQEKKKDNLRGLTRATYILCIEHPRQMCLNWELNSGPTALQANTLYAKSHSNGIRNCYSEPRTSTECLFGKKRNKGRKQR
jgi:hypothetical protein